MIYTLQNIYELSLIDNPVKISKILKSKDKWKQYVLEQTIVVELSNGKVIQIKKGFEWDLSSVPRIFWTLLLPNGDFIIAALVHDYLYQNSQLVIDEMFEGNSKHAKQFADKEMLFWSKAVNGTNKISLMKIDNYTRYYGVRLFGWTAWNKH